MTTVRKLIEEKAEAKIYTVPSNATVFDALLVMCEGNTGAVLVTEEEKIVGIFTERDYAREGEVKGRSARDTIVSDVMTSQMVLIKPETTLEECAELMRKYHVRHLRIIYISKLFWRTGYRSTSAFPVFDPPVYWNETHMAVKKLLLIGYGSPDREDDGVAWHILRALTVKLGLDTPAS